MVHTKKKEKIKMRYDKKNISLQMTSSNSFRCTLLVLSGDRSSARCSSVSASDQEGGVVTGEGSSYMDQTKGRLEG